MIQQGQFEVFESEEAAGRGNVNFETLSVLNNQI